MTTKTTTIDAKPRYRFFDVAAASVNRETKTVEVAFSSEAPVDQMYGFERVREVLDHSPGAADLSLLNAGAPVLVNHDPRDHVGVVESARIDGDQRGRAVLRFGKSAAASQYFEDVADGIRRGVSVGYRVLKIAEATADGVTRVLNWTPFEISLASVAADALNTGVGRHADDSPNPCEVITTMNDKTDEKTDDKAKATPTAAERSAYQADVISHEREQARTEERERCDHIRLLGRKFGCDELAAEFIRNGKDASAFRAAVIENQSGSSNGIPVLGTQGQSPTGTQQRAFLDMEPKEVQRYSILKAIRSLINPHDPKSQRAAAFELEVSQEAQRLTGHQAEGVLLPFDEGKRMQGVKIPEDILMAPRLDGSRHSGQRTLVTTSAASAGNLVSTDLLAGSFIDVLRNSTIVAGLGATMLPDLVGDVAIPRKTAAATAAWLTSESASIGVSDLTTDLVTLTPRDIGARQHYSRRMLNQSSVGVEQLVRDDLAQSIAVGWDLAALYGTGSSGQPTGVANTSGIGAPTAFAAAVPTWAEVVALIGEVASNNALQGSLAYIIEGAMMASLMATTKDSGSGQFVYQGGQIGDYSAPFTNQVTSGDVFFGNWSDLLIGMWGGGLDITVDPYTLAETQLTRVIAVMSVDFAVRHPESFALNNDTA